MIFIAISKFTPQFSMEAATPLLRAEARAAWDLHMVGKIFAIHFDQVALKGIVLVEAASREDVPDILQALPLVSEGLIEFDVYHLGPFGGLEGLFSQAD